MTIWNVKLGVILSIFLPWIIILRKIHTHQPKEGVMVKKGMPTPRIVSLWLYLGGSGVVIFPCLIFLQIDLFELVMGPTPFLWVQKAVSLVAYVALLGISILAFAAGLYTTWTAWPKFVKPKRYKPKGDKVLLGAELKHEVEEEIVRPTGDQNSGQQYWGEVTHRRVIVWRGRNQPYYVDLSQEVNPHIVISGTSGSGKTVTVKTLTARYWNAKKIPSFFIDWVGEFSEFVSKLGGITFQVPVDFKINPLELHGLSPTQRAAQVAEALMFTVDLTPLQAQKVEELIGELYRAKGIYEEDPKTWSRNPPQVKDLEALIFEKIASKTVTKSQVEWLQWVILKLHQLEHIFGSELKGFFDVIFKTMVCVNLSRLTTDSEKAMISYTILQRIYEKMNVMSDLRLLVVLDEAWQILKVKTVEGMVQEPLPTRIVRLGRKYGFGVIISTQMINDVPEPILSNAGSMIIHRFSEPHQVGYISKFISLSDPEQFFLQRLPKGACFVRQSSLEWPALTQVQMLNESELPNLPEVKIEALQIEPLVEPEPQQISTETPTSGRAEPAVKYKLSEFEETLVKLLRNDAYCVEDLLEVLPDLSRKHIDQSLKNLCDKGLIKKEHIANLQGKGTTYYSARSDLEAESIEHMGLIKQVESYLKQQGFPIERPPGKFIEAPDLSVGKKLAIDVETGRKRRNKEQLKIELMRVKVRNTQLGYKFTLIVVPNADIYRKYKAAIGANTNLLILVSMNKFIEAFTELLRYLK